VVRTIAKDVLWRLVNDANRQPMRYARAIEALNARHLLRKRSASASIRRAGSTGIRAD